MSAIVHFAYEKRTIDIQCLSEEELSHIYQKFATKINPNLGGNEFDFFYNGSKLSSNLKNLNESIFQGKKEIIIFVEKKSKFVKCPICVYNNCMIDIDNYVINFYGCKYNHIDCKVFNSYPETQKINLSKILCDNVGCDDKNQSNDPEDFYKCITCSKSLSHTQYYCSLHSKEHDKNIKQKHFQIKYGLRNYYCDKHEKKFIKYCFECRQNLCENCSDDHKNHSIKEYDSISPNINDFKDSLDKIKDKIEQLKIIIDYIKKHYLDRPLKIFNDYCEILYDIIEKYELYNVEFKNYEVLKNFLNLKKSNKKIMDDLDKIINEENYQNKANYLINIFLNEQKNYKNNTKNLNNLINKYENKSDYSNDLMEWEGKNKILKKDENYKEKKKSINEEKKKANNSSGHKNKKYK